jgi:hypothetical protein
MDLRSVAVEETAFLHLRSSKGDLLYEAGDASKPVGITMYSPGTKIHARAQAAKNSRLMERMKKRGKVDMSAEEAAEENATFLAAVTKEFHFIERDELKDEALFKAVYSDVSHGFIAEQAASFQADWGNFSKGSPTN